MTPEQLTALRKRCVDEKLDGVFVDAYIVHYVSGDIMYGDLVIDMKNRAFISNKNINTSLIQKIEGDIVTTLNSRYMALWRKPSRQR